MARSTEKKRSFDDVSDRSRAWELAEIVDPVQCRMVTVPDSMGPLNKVFSASFPFMHKTLN